MIKEEIHRICRKYNIRNYTINPDGYIDVNGDVELGYLNLDKIPLNFNIVSGYFNISKNNLSSLEGCPKYIGDSFHCNYNKISTFEHFPNEISGSVYLTGNNLKNLKGFGKVGGITYLHGNPLESLEGYNGNYGYLFVNNRNKLIRKTKLKILDVL